MSEVAPLSPYSPTLLLLGIFFTLLGWWVSQQTSFSGSFAFALMAGGTVLALLEGAALKRLFHASSHQVMDYPYAVRCSWSSGFFMDAGAPDARPRHSLPFLARFTLGVYVSHIFIDYTLASRAGSVAGSADNLASPLYIGGVWVICAADVGTVAHSIDTASP